MTQLDAEFVDVVERSETLASEHVPEHGALPASINTLDPKPPY
jgi:hypothetical protein